MQKFKKQKKSKIFNPILLEQISSNLSEEVLKYLTNVKDKLSHLDQNERYEESLKNEKESFHNINQHIEKLHKAIVANQLNNGELLWHLNLIVTNLKSICHNLKRKYGESLLNASPEIKPLISSGQIFIKSLREKKKSSSTNKKSKISKRILKQEKQLVMKQEELSSEQKFIKWLSYLRSYCQRLYVPKELFISYAWPIEDVYHEAWTHPFISKLADHLREGGLIVFLDQHQSGAGRELQDFMEKRIRKADHVLVFSSRTMDFKYKKERFSGACYEYLQYLERHREERDKRFIIPIQLNEKDYSPGFVKKFAGVSFYPHGYTKALIMLFTKIYNVGAEAEKDWTAKANELGLIEEPALKSLSPQVKTSYSNQSKKQKREKKPIGEKDEKFKKDKTPGSCALSDEIVSKTSLQDKPRKNQSNFAKIKAGGSVVIIEGNNYGSLFLPPSDLPLPRQFAQSTLDVESPQIAYFDKEKKEAPTLKSYSPGMFIGAGCFPHGISPTNVKINNRAGEDDSLDLPQNETVPKIWNLSAENNYFTGREKRLSKLRKHFEEKNSYQSRKEIIHVTYGPGGTGKTQLLKKYAHESKSLYDIVFWFDASGNLDAQFKVFAEELKQRFGFNIITEGVEPAKICKAVKDTLRSCDLHWLLLFDNASDPEKLKKFLPQQHAKKRGHIMINSRNPQWGAYPHSRLKPFMPEEAVLYIQKRLKGIKVAKAIELAEFSGNIPLALAQALMLITECPSINGINGYIEMLQNEKEKVRKLEEDLLNRRRKVWKEESEEIELPLDEGNITVTAAINISIKQIQTLLGFELLFFTSFLDCSSIPLFLLKEWCFKRGYDLNRDFDFSINELTRGALLELDQKEHEDANYSIHELLQEVSGKIVSDNEHITDNRNQLLVTLLAVINDNFTYNKYRKESFAKSKILFPHAIKIAEYAVKNRIELKATTTLLARLRDYYLYYLGDYHAALEYAEKAIELSKIVYEEVVQDDLTKIENQILLAKATHGCGTVLRRHQKFDNAKGIFEKALMMKLDIYQTREHPDIAKTIHSIADMDYSLGNYELSLHGFEEALAIERKNYMLGDPNYQLIGVTLHGVGNVLIKQKKYSLAVEKFREAVKIKAEAFKDMLDHPDLAVTIRALASGLCYLGKEEEEKGHSREARILFEEAVKNFEQVLLIQERNYPNKHHPQIAETHTRFAEMHVQAGNKEEAMVHYKKAYNIFQQVLGAENSKTISCHSALQNLCRETSMIKSDAKGMYLNKG